jgi:hypothetical protein
MMCNSRAQCRKYRLQLLLGRQLAYCLPSVQSTGVSCRMSGVDNEAIVVDMQSSMCAR